MPIFTIETSYRVPVFRWRRYEAETLAEACRLAIEDDDWSRQWTDYDSSSETYVTGIWPGDVQPYSLPGLAVPAQFDETLQRKAEHFEVLLGLLKVLAQAPEGSDEEKRYWRTRADAAIAKAEAIFAEARDPS